MTEINKEDAERELTDLMVEWFERIKHHDSAWFASIMDDDWTYVMIDGSVKDKEWYVTGVQHPFDDGPDAEVHELTARVLGNIAIAHGHYTVKGTYQGQDMSSHTRFTAVWRKLDDRWQALTHHATQIAE